MGQKEWSGKRTLDHCSLITRCVKAGLEKPVQRNGKCLGYQKSQINGEPCEQCKSCKLNDFFEE